jgi:hypothetical protein
MLRFPFGEILITPGVADATLNNPQALAACVRRHVSGDWGEIDAEDKGANEAALIHGTRLLSVYTIDGVKIWIITEADRSVTTILLPDEY